LGVVCTKVVVQGKGDESTEGAVYMIKSRGPRREPWGTPQEDEKVLLHDLHLKQKERDDNYDLNQGRTEPWIPNKMKG